MVPYQVEYNGTLTEYTKQSSLKFNIRDASCVITMKEDYVDCAPLLIYQKKIWGKEVLPSYKFDFKHSYVSKKILKQKIVLTVSEI